MNQPTDKNSRVTLETITRGLRQIARDPSTPISQGILCTAVADLCVAVADLAQVVSELSRRVGQLEGPVGDPPPHVYDEAEPPPAWDSPVWHC